MFNPLSLLQATSPVFWYKLLAFVIFEVALMGGAAWYARTDVIESQVIPLQTAIKEAEAKALELKLRVDADAEAAAQELVMKSINDKERADAVIAEYKRQHPDGGKRASCGTPATPGGATVPYHVLSEDGRAALNLLIGAPTPKGTK